MSLQVPNDKLRVQLQRGKEVYIGEITYQFLAVDHLKLRFPLAQLKLQDCQINAGKYLFTVKKEVREYIFDTINLFNQGNRIPTSTRLFAVTDVLENRKVEIAAIPGFFIVKMVQSDTYYRANASILSAVNSKLLLRVQTRTAVLSDFEFENEKDVADFVYYLRSINVKIAVEELEPLPAKLSTKFDCGFTKYYKYTPKGEFVDIAPYDVFVYTDVGVSGDRLVISQDGKELTGCALESIWCMNFFEFTYTPKSTYEQEHDMASQENTEKQTGYMAQVKLCDNTRFLLVFATQLERQLFAQFVLDCLTQRFIAPQLYFYEFAPEFGIDLPYSPCSGKLILQLFDSFDKVNCGISTALLIENDARTLPVTTKRTEILGILFSMVQQSSDSAVVASSFDLMRRLVTSRTLYISVVRDYQTQLRAALKLYIGAGAKLAGSERVIVSALLFLRSVLSYYWDPQVSGPGKSVSGVFQAYSVGIFSQIYVSLLQKPVKQYFRCAPEMAAFYSLGVDETESFKASIGIHTIFQQGKNYTATRHAAESQSRAALFAQPNSIMPLIGGFVAYLSAIKFPLVQTSVLGIVEDILITKSQIEQRIAQTSTSAQPVGRSDLFTLIYECYSVFVAYSASEVQGLRIACSLILYYILNENILSDEFKAEISEHFLTSGAILVHMQTIMRDEASKQLKQVSMALLGTLYFINKNVQNMFHKVFPTSMLSDLQVQTGPVGFDYAGFQTLGTPQIRNIFELDKRIVMYKYSIDIVWDQNIVQNIIEQIDMYLADFKANKQLTDGPVAFNYELMRIKHNGVSLHKYSQFDIDINGYFLSQFLTTTAANQANANAIGADLTDFYNGKSNIHLYVELAEKLQNRNVKSIVDLFYRAYSQIPHDRDVKAALIYAIHSMLIAAPVDFDFVRELATEVTVQLQQESYALVLFLMSLLECVGYQINKKDMLRRNYFNMLSEHFVLKFIVFRVLPLLCFDQAALQAETILGVDLELIQHQTYGNLVLTAMRIVRCCIAYQSNKDYDGHVLYPSPTIYSLLSEQEVLNILLALFVVCCRSHSASGPAVVDEIAVQELRLIAQLVREINGVAQDLLKLGFVEALLANPFDADVNIEVFELLRLIIYHTDDGCAVLQRCLPIPFCTYISKYEAADSASIFVAERYLSLNIIWTAKARCNVQTQLHDFYEHIWNRLAQLYQQEFLHGKYQNPLTITSFDDQDASFAFYNFETPDQHPEVELDDELRCYEVHRSGDVYLQLINVDNFISVHEQLEHSEGADFIAQHDEMLRKFYSCISMQQCLEYLKATLAIDSFDAVLEDDFIFNGLTDYSAYYIHTIVLLLLRSAQEQFSALVGNIRQFYKEEQMIRQSLEYYINSTGGSGKSVLKSKKLSDPAQIQAKRKLLVTVYLKLLIVIFKITKTIIKTLKSLPYQFDNYRTLQCILRLAQFLESLGYSAYFKQIASFIPDTQSHYCQKVTDYAIHAEKAQQDLRQAIIDLLPLYLTDILENPEKDALPESFSCVVALVEKYAHVEMFATNSVFELILSIFTAFKQRSETTAESQLSYLEHAVNLLVIASRYRSYGKAIIESRLFAYLFICMFDGNNAAAQALVQLSQNVSELPQQTSAFLASLSFLGHAFRAYQDSAFLCYRVCDDVHTEKFVYTSALREHIADFLWEQALGDIDYNVRFNETYYLPKELRVEQFYLGSMLSIFLKQYGAHVGPEVFALPNFAAAVQMQSNASEIFYALSQFLVCFYRRRYQARSSEIDISALRQLSDADCTVFTAVIALLLVECTTQDHLMQAFCQQDELVAMCMSFASGHADSHLQECLAELALLVITAVGCKNKIVHENAKNLIYLVTDNVTMQQGFVQLAFPAAQDLQTMFTDGQYALAETTEQFTTFDYVFMNRKCYAYNVLAQLIYHGPVPYLNIVELMLFVQHTPRFAVQDADAYPCNYYMLKTSAKMLYAMCPNDLFLQNMLQKPLLLSFIKGIPADTCDLFQRDSKAPNFVWNQQCSQDLLQFLTRLFRNQIIPAMTSHQSVNLTEYSFQEHIAFIADTYFAQGFYLSHTFVNVYNDSCLKRETFLANPAEFIAALMQVFTQQFASPDNAQVFLLYLYALTNVVTQQAEFIPQVIQNSNFERLIVLLFIENYYMNLLPYQVSQQVLRLVGQLLESVLHVLSDFAISKQTFHDLVVVFFSSMPQVSFTLDHAVEQPAFSLYTAEKALIALSAFITILLQNPALKIDFCSMQIGRIQGESVIAPLLSYQLLTQDGVPRFIKISQICALAQLFERSVDFTSIFRQRYSAQKYSEFVAAVLACQVGFKTPINGGAKEALDDAVPIPDCEIYREWSAAPPAKIQTDGFDAQDCENCLGGFAYCRRVPKVVSALINGVQRSLIDVELSELRRVCCARSCQLSVVQLCYGEKWSEKYGGDNILYYAESVK